MHAGMFVAAQMTVSDVSVLTEPSTLPGAVSSMEYPSTTVYDFLGVASFGDIPTISIVHYEAGVTTYTMDCTATPVCRGASLYTLMQANGLISLWQPYEIFRNGQVSPGPPTANTDHTSIGWWAADCILGDGVSGTCGASFFDLPFTLDTPLITPSYLPNSFFIASPRQVIAKVTAGFDKLDRTPTDTTRKFLRPIAPA